jgi:hypothetical protein
VRTIYFYAASNSVMLLIDIYAKNRKDTLTDAEKTAIRKVVKEFQRSFR